MKLTSDEQALLDGKKGPAPAFAMDLLFKAGALQGATKFQEIEAAYVNTTFATVETHNDLLAWLVEKGTKVAIPTYTNVGIHDVDNPWIRDDATGRHFTQISRQLTAFHREIGCKLAMTCAPYQLPGRPGLGAQIACSESNAVSYFNSVLGARTLKYGDYLDIAAAIVGRVPYMGLHSDEGRRASVVFEVEELPPALAADDLSFQLIGHAMGRKAGMDIPVLVGVDPKATEDNLRSIAASGAAAGGVPLFHVVGLTPEAPNLEAALGGQEPTRREAITLKDLLAAKAELTQFDQGPINAVVIGTPHAALSEVGALAALLNGRRIADGLVFYIQMNRFVLERAREKGWIEKLHAAGVKAVADTCLYWRPVAQGLQGRILTNSGKYAYYAPGELGAEVSIASLRECVESAVRGALWRDPELLS